MVVGESRIATNRKIDTLIKMAERAEEGKGSSSAERADVSVERESQRRMSRAVVADDEYAAIS